jgi:hypothetical protein
MSGNYGWCGRDRTDDLDSRSYNQSGFSRAHQAYDTGAPASAFDDADSRLNRSRRASSVRMTRGSLTPAVDLNPRKAQKTTAKNVIIIDLDTTGSMDRWKEEIFKRLPLLYKEAQGFLGDDLEVLFITHGDIQRCGDPFEVAPLGAGPILDQYIAALCRGSIGGGNAIESAELGALYVNSLLDTSEAKSVYFITITDEGFYSNLDPATADAIMGLRLPPELTSATELYRGLKPRMNVFTILPQTNAYSATHMTQIKNQWDEALGAEFVVPLDDARRVVDVILGIIGKTTGQYGKFTQTLNNRQGGTQHGSQNISNVHQSLALVPGAQAPSVKAGTKSLLDVNAPAVPAVNVTDSSTTHSGSKSLTDV